MFFLHPFSILIGSRYLYILINVPVFRNQNILCSFIFETLYCLNITYLEFCIRREGGFLISCLRFQEEGMASSRKMLFCLVLSFCLLNSALSMPYPPEEEEEEGNELKLEDEPEDQNAGEEETGYVDEDYEVNDVEEDDQIAETDDIELYLDAENLVKDKKSRTDNVEEEVESNEIDENVDDNDESYDEDDEDDEYIPEDDEDYEDDDDYEYEYEDKEINESEEDKYPELALQKGQEEEDISKDLDEEKEEEITNNYFRKGDEGEMGFGVDEDSIGEVNEKPDIMQYLARKLKSFWRDHE